MLLLFLPLPPSLSQGCSSIGRHIGVLRKIPAITTWFCCVYVGIYCIMSVVSRLEGIIFFRGNEMRWDGGIHQFGYNTAQPFLHSLSELLATKQMVGVKEIYERKMFSISCIYYLSNNKCIRRSKRIPSLAAFLLLQFSPWWRGAELLSFDFCLSVFSPPSHSLVRFFSISTHHSSWLELASQSLVPYSFFFSFSPILTNFEFCFLSQKVITSVLLVMELSGFAAGQHVI